jgi:hypothetical protein
VMCYGISRAYKESTNCRMEAQYAHQREKDMVPLMVEEGYRADGWLGMLLGTRLYYVFYGGTVSSEAAFEGKMEELCRELGDRGQQQGAASLPGSPQACDDALALSAGGAARFGVLVASLQAALQVLASLTAVRRSERKAHADRAEAALDVLELEESARPAWLLSDWAPQHAEQVAEAIAHVRSADSSTGMHAVAGLLSVLDSLAGSHVGRAEAVWSALQQGGAAAEAVVSSVLEHGLQVLESLSAVTPRRGRRPIKQACAGTEAALDSLDAGELMVGPPSGSEEQADALSALCAALCAVESLVLGQVEAEAAIACVERVLDELAGQGGKCHACF